MWTLRRNFRHSPVRPLKERKPETVRHASEYMDTIQRPWSLVKILCKHFHINVIAASECIL